MILYGESYYKYRKPMEMSFIPFKTETFKNQRPNLIMWVKEEEEPHNRPSVTQRVPGGLGSQIS
jgi:hypothetical protein